MMTSLRSRIKENEMSLRSFNPAKPLIATLAIAVSLAASFFDSAEAAPKKSEAGQKKVKVWQISQKTQLGLTNWLISDSGIKVSLPAHGISWLCAGPSWKVLVHNAKLNIGLEHVLDFYGRLRSQTVEFGRVDPNSVVTSKTLFQGRPATKVMARVISSDPAIEKLEMMYQQSKSRSDTFKRVETIYSSWIPLNPQEIAFICGYYKNTVNGIRLEEVHVYTTRRQVVLSTISMKETTVPASEFTYPTGFRKVRKMHQIMQEEDKARQMSGVIEDLFMDTDAKPKTKKKQAD